MPRTAAFPVVRYDAFLAKSTTEIDSLVKVVKVVLDSDTARAEAERLNQLRPEADVRYWVQATHLETPE